ncbi:ABATE domain-containing protein [Allokutzneria sp. A3M-2-11 16]|uniref:CGNR zinc finger domain-containing protein n=1 Tax=Allokutzneria sp. A3M-2-11 16 TaxID=2962043 RepID=UPI0020B82112|nr:ABATE domain-containing protein [Allokutzneria sp. A3M-2-11 16]MCP3803242.1 ABATE domain-containing protein [Allokutzneria sp. A3M-2-11 16]
MNTASTVWTDDHFIAGDLALDFANTVYRRTPEMGADLFDSPEALAAWLHRAGFPSAAATVDDARMLRERLWEIFDAQTAGRELPPDAFGGLLETVRRDDVSVGADGSARALTGKGALAVIALHAIRFALSPPPWPVRSCDGCGWFFMDTSRGHRRRWCSMKTCGNQAKAARFRSRDQKACSAASV